MLGAIFEITKPVHAAVVLLFLGVPTQVSYSRFLSLIPLRLLRDPPPQTRQPHLFSRNKAPQKTSMNILKRLCSPKLAAHVSGSPSAPKAHEHAPFYPKIIDHFRRTRVPGTRRTPPTGHLLLLPSSGPVMNSLPSTLRFHLTFISYANAGRRKPFVTGRIVQPSSFVTLLLCQTPKRSSPLCLPTFANKVLVNEENYEPPPPHTPRICLILRPHYGRACPRPDRGSGRALS